VSQFLIKEVVYNGVQDPEETFFRTVLFKLFNRIDTWQLLLERLGEPLRRSWTPLRVSRELERRRETGSPIYSAAYIMPPAPQFGSVRKHEGHLRLLAQMMTEKLPQRYYGASSLRDATGFLQNYKGIGPFLAFQYAIDLNYSAHGTFHEMEHVVVGPGARDGLRKCFVSFGDYSESVVIRWVTERQADECDRLELPRLSLMGRALQLIDVQNLFCEVDKYARVVHPELKGVSGRSRIKQRFRPLGPLPPLWLPPKWGLSAVPQNGREAARVSTEHLRSAAPGIDFARMPRGSKVDSE
jgi:hypothetical protein